MNSINLAPVTENIEILEESLVDIDVSLLDVLLADRTSKKNILWATDEYAYLGAEYEASAEIKPELITNGYLKLIQPRITKAQTAKTDRTKDMAEVFTPSWVCNRQNNLIDEQWFGKKHVFNFEFGSTWKVVREKISFEGENKSWNKYVDAKRIEIACGEAPYIVSRYDTVTGEKIPIMDRIGILDRKMRIVQENTVTAEEWLTWSQRAFESVYGYEYQGDSLFLARKNLLFSYIDYYDHRFSQHPSLELLQKIARIISWNIWQMDGTKCVIPGSCTPVEEYQLSVFDLLDTDSALKENNLTQCPGCKNGDIFSHTGIYCKIMDWRSNSSCTYVSLLREGNGFGGL